MFEIAAHQPAFRAPVSVGLTYNYHIFLRDRVEY
jgi:hypothetical protein